MARDAARRGGRPVGRAHLRGHHPAGRHQRVRDRQLEADGRWAFWKGVAGNLANPLTWRFWLALVAGDALPRLG
ncbi:MAG TPA: hypothetical protein VLA80_04810 [Actinomycetota bacterium]|nr:hypothetical protein [Actinomycetota bacterium]